MGSTSEQLAAVGGTLVAIAGSAEGMKSRGISCLASARAAVTKLNISAKDERERLLSGISPALVHFRIPVPVPAFEAAAGVKTALDNALAFKSSGAGIDIGSLIDPEVFAGTDENLRRTRWNVQKFYRQLFVNLGVRTKTETARQLCAPSSFAPIVEVPLWQVWEKTWDSGGVSKIINERHLFPALGEKTEAEQWVEHPSAPRPVSVSFELKSVDANGFLDLSDVSPAKTGRIGYALTYVYSSKPRNATFVFSADWWLVFRVNGNAYYDNSVVGRIPRSPTGSEHKVMVPLVAGWNKVEIKVASGTGGFGFWCRMSDPGDLRVQPSLHMPDSTPNVPTEGLLSEPLAGGENLLYAEPLKREDDPYGFSAW
jgi:beta-galactosidase